MDLLLGRYSVHSVFVRGSILIADLVASVVRGTHLRGTEKLRERVCVTATIGTRKPYQTVITVCDDVVV